VTSAERRATTTQGRGLGERLRRLSLDDVWVFAAVALIALRALLTAIPPHDFWWHMATGRLIAATGSVPTVDGFSYTRAGEPFFNQSWLAQLLMYGLHELGGIALLVAFQALLLAGAYGLLLRLCLRRTGAVRLSAGFIMAATMPASFDNWIVRPQTYALPLFVGFLYVLDRWRTDAGATGRDGLAGRWRRTGLWLLPVLGALWVNLHGSFVLGGALVALTFAGETVERWWQARRGEAAWASRPVGQAEDVLERAEPARRQPLADLLLAGVLVGASWLLNPSGLAVLGYVRGLLGSSAVTRLVTEWAPPTIRDPNSLIFFLFITLGIAILAYSRRRPALSDMLLAGAFMWLGLSAVRNNIWFTAAATPLLVAQLASLRDPAHEARPFQGLPALNTAVIGIFALLLALALPWVKPALDLPPQLGALIDVETPVAGVERLRADPQRPARLFHALGYGSYLIWAAPEQKVWVDPRIELYPLEQWRDYQRLSAGEGAADLLDEYRVDGLLLSREEQAGLVEYARARPQEWELRYEDDYSAYFVRR
jgi:hypothetical protein